MSQKDYYTELEKEFIHVYQDRKTGIGYAVWKAWANEENYRKAVEAQAEIITKKKLKHLICDIREFKGTTPAAQKYTTEEIMPRIYNAASIKKIAYVVGENAFANFTLTSIRKEIDREAYVVTNAFTSVEEAEKWIQE